MIFKGDELNLEDKLKRIEQYYNSGQKMLGDFPTLQLRRLIYSSPRLGLFIEKHEFSVSAKNAHIKLGVVQPSNARRK